MGVRLFLMPHLIHVEYEVGWGIRDVLPEEPEMFLNRLDWDIHSGRVHRDAGASLNIGIASECGGQSVG
jgi:hypothetical protein